MSLRRFAQTNHASVSSDPSSPMVRKTANAGVGPSTPSTPSPLSPYNGVRTPITQSPGSPLAGKGGSQDSFKNLPPKKMLPVTPRRVQISHAVPSPANSPSLSASMPFDWAAARSRRPPPYGSPVASVAQRKKRQSLAGGADSGTPAGKRFVRQKGFMEK